MKFQSHLLLLATSTFVSSVMSSSTTNNNNDVSARHHRRANNDALTLHANIPYPKPYQVTYEDGTKSPLIQIKMTGDLESASHHIYEETLDGFTVTPAADKGNKYVYVEADTVTGELHETNLIAGVDDPFKFDLPKGAAQMSEQILEKNGIFGRNLNKYNSDNTIDHKRSSNNDHGDDDIVNPRRRTAITSGTLKNLVVPFKFSDHTTRSLPSRSDLDILMNAPGGDPNLCPTGSVRDVYLENSFNALDVDSEVHEWVTIDKTEAECAAGNSGLTSSFHSCLTAALDKVVEAGNINFGDFDRDGDGFIDGIAFFHSGYAAEWGGIDAYGASSSNRIWSHKWAIFTTNWSQSGVRVYTYHISPAVWSTSGSTIGRIGVVAHETGHFLGLPDLYDYGAGSGIGSYGLMANSWGFDYSQYYPPLMSAWGKEELGWTNPQEVSTSGSYSLRQACDFNDMIKITAGFPSGEYLLIENRQPCGVEAVMPQGGLAIFHVDTSANNNLGHPWQSGWPSNGNHYNVALLQADGDYYLERGFGRGDSTDLFHAGGVNSIGPNGISNGLSYPNTNSYQSGNIQDTEVTISNISAAGSTMTFDITIGSDTTTPTKAPVVTPTKAPTKAPVVTPTKAPTKAPVVTPTKAPTKAPVVTPTKAPTKAPVVTPTKAPTKAPVVTPTKAPVVTPTKAPTKAPVVTPTKAPVVTPTKAPVVTPTKAPVVTPTKAPVVTPTKAPVANPTSCEDNPDKFFVGNRRRSCFWVGKKNTQRRCRNQTILLNCPDTCGACVSSTCEDTTATFKVNGRNRRCGWAGRGNSEARCAKGRVSELCPVTCKSCPE